MIKFESGKKGFAALFFELLSNGYSDITVSEMNRTLVVRLLVWLAMPIGWLLPFRNRSSLFFFFPFFHVGGAERVHADIVACVADRKPWVIFTKKSQNEAFRHLFERGSRLFNLWPFCKYFYPLSLGIAAGFINRHRAPVVLGSNSLFFYLLVPYLRPEIRCIDLTHAFGGGGEDFSLYTAERLCKRVVINRKTRNDFERQYADNQIDPTLSERIVVIGNSAEVPEICPEKSVHGPLLVLYVGRSSEEKRVHLIGRAARLCESRGIAAVFLLVGDVYDAVNPADREFCQFAGEVSNAEELAALYRKAHAVVIASSREGFPMTVMEGMANGAVPICTAVGGIPEHVRNGENGFLVANNDEGEVASALADAVVLLDKDRSAFTGISRNAHAYARKHFGRDSFCAEYWLLIGEQVERGRD